MRKLTFVGMLGIALLCFGSFTNTGSNDPAKDANAASVADKDSRFMVELTYLSMYTVEASKEAETTSADADVKDLAKMLVTDHDMANKEMQDLASQKSVSLPTTMSQENMDKLAKLREKKGQDFDNAYIEMMQSAHSKMVMKMEDASKNADDADVKAWAAKMLPTCKTHKEKADAMKEKKGIITKEKLIKKPSKK